MGRLSAHDEQRSSACHISVTGYVLRRLNKGGSRIGDDEGTRITDTRAAGARYVLIFAIYFRPLSAMLEKIAAMLDTTTLTISTQLMKTTAFRFR